jgi:hypothetical protein
MFQNVFDVFMAELKNAGLAGNLMEQKLRAQTEYIDIISRYDRAVIVSEMTVFNNSSMQTVVSALLAMRREEKTRRRPPCASCWLRVPAETSPMV